MVSDAVEESYGISATLQRLPGENLNYLVTAAGGQKWVAKIAGEGQGPDMIAMEYQALCQAARADLGFAVPEIILNREGKVETRIEIGATEAKRLRLINFISGNSLEDTIDISENLLREVGISLARFDRAMEGFDHPAAHRSHRWNLAEAGQHRHCIDLIQDPRQRALLTWAFDQWAERAEPRLAGLPWQFIHGDPNPENVLVEGERVSGLLDFGDACCNPTICELAICLAYLMMDRNDLQAVARATMAGYESVRPLSEPERAVLFPLVCGRLAVTISVAAGRRLIDPRNTNWFVSEAKAWRLVAGLNDGNSWLV